MRIRALRALSLAAFSAISLASGASFAQPTSPPVAPAKPVTLLDSAVSVELVRCSSTLERKLASYLFGPRVLVYSADVVFDNGGPTAAPIESAHVLLTGARTGHPATEGGVIVEPNKEFAAGDLGKITLRFNPNMLPFDRYTGWLRVRVKGLAEPLVTNLSVTTREGPLAAILMVIAGIIAGRAARYLERPDSVLQLKLLPRYYALRAKISLLQVEEQRQAFGAEVEVLHEQIREAKESVEAITLSLDALENKVRLCVEADQVAAAVASLPSGALRDEARRAVVALRAAAQNGDALGVAAQKSVIAGALKKLENDSKMGEEEKLTQLSAALSTPLAKRSLARPPSLPLTGWRKLAAQVLVKLAGTGYAGPELKYWFLHPLVTLLTLVLLVLLGLQTQYVSANATFGSGGIYDYLGLFLWGLSAEIAQASLLKLPARSA
jgi:hypothetical protein